MPSANLTNYPRMMLLLLTMLSTSVMGKIIYVDDEANGAYNGSCWVDAYNYLQDALTNASAGDLIQVAQGIYKPDLFVLSERANQCRMETFRLKNGVVMRGGYAGLRELNANARNFDLYETILSGDLAGNDININDPQDLFDESIRIDNCFRVVTSSVTNKTAILDGFTITGGNHHGIYNQSGSPTLINCKFIANRANTWGGGLYNDSGSPRLINCSFIGNHAKYGAGLWNSGGNPILTECIFSDNSAVRGGGMCNYRSRPALINCKFSENRAELGGGISNENNSNTNLIDCIFINNHSSAGKLNSYGSGMYNKQSNPTLTCCNFNNNKAQWGGGMYNDNSNPIIINCTFGGNLAGWGGGIYNRRKSNPILTNCTFSGNRADRWGGGICNFNSNPWLSNCTFGGNIAASLGGGVYSYGSKPILINSIIWGNEAPKGSQIYDDGEGSAIVSYCNIQGGHPGHKNMNTDPVFVNSRGIDNILGTIDDNLQLSLGSPCINVGDNSAVLVSVTTDLNGNNRIINGIVDFGAYEWAPQATKSSDNVKVSAPGFRTTTMVLDTSK